MNTKLASINLEVADPERSKRFYLDVLGLVEDNQRSHPPGFVYLSSEGCALTLAHPPHAEGAAAASAAEPSRTMELGFEVADIAAMRDHLAALGVRDFREESMGWGDAIELRDHDGHRVLVYAFKRRE